MTLRRRTPLRARHLYKPPPHKDPIDRAVRIYVHARDGGCVLGRLLHDTDRCWGGLELDHVRASRGMGMKSESTARNLATLCSFHHQVRTDNGRILRPVLLAYLRNAEGDLPEEAATDASDDDADAPGGRGSSGW